MAVDLQPTEAMAAEAERGLAWREEFGRGGTAGAELLWALLERVTSRIGRISRPKQSEGW